MHTLHFLIVFIVVLIFTGCGSGSSTGVVNTAPVTNKVQPSILIIGGQTSLQWTSIVTSKMNGIAIVQHAYLPAGYPSGIDGAGGNDGNSTMQAAAIVDWMKYGYNIVHFDAELDYDLCHPNLPSVSIAQYVANITYMVNVIRAAGGIPIYATPLGETCHPVVAAAA